MSARRLVLGLLSLGAALAVAVVPGDAHAQASKAQMQAFPMPPPSGFHTTKSFAYAGDYGYYTAPSTATYNMSSTKAADYKYVRYTGISGKDVYVYGAWGTTVPPDPPGEADACSHAHASWGVWARWSIVMPGVGTLGAWNFVGGGGTSGVRNAQGTCQQKTDNDLVSIDPSFGWGETFKHLDLRNTTFYKELVVGALSNTHGWGTCTAPGGGFQACHEPSYVIGYTLP